QKDRRRALGERLDEALGAAEGVGELAAALLEVRRTRALDDGRDVARGRRRERGPRRGVERESSQEALIPVARERAAHDRVELVRDALHERREVRNGRLQDLAERRHVALALEERRVRDRLEEDDRRGEDVAPAIELDRLDLLRRHVRRFSLDVAALR